MKSLAVICEYNPFHNGHKLLLSEIKKSFPEYVIISVMSGNTVQRGDFSIFYKYDRARSSILNGSDLVFELPFPFSASAGEQFARAGVSVCRELKASRLVFGSESGNLEKLKEIAKNLNTDEFSEMLKKEIALNPSAPFIALREKTYKALYGEPLSMDSNDILGVEYLRCTEKHGDITPSIIHRTVPFSATKAREALYANDAEKISSLIPENSVFPKNFASQKSSASSKNSDFHKSSDFPEKHGGLSSLSSLVLGHLRLTAASDNGNGIRNAIKSAAERASDFDKFISLLPTKSYTLARLRREILAMLLNVTDDDKNELPKYTLLLGSNQKGLDYLSEKRKSITLPILTKKSDSKSLSGAALKQLEKAMLCDSIYSLGLSSPKGYFETPYILK